MVMDPFIPNHSFLNPKFEGYKFDPVSQEDSVICYDLEHRPTQIAISGIGESPLSFHEVQSRITHNHLAVTPQGGRAVYIDAEYKVIIVDVDLVSTYRSFHHNVLLRLFQTTLLPIFRVLYELPRPIQTVHKDRSHREYPSAAFLRNDCVFVCDGLGALYILQINDAGAAVICGMYRLPSESDCSPSPFRVHSVSEISPNKAFATLSSRNYENNPPVVSASHQNGSIPVQYDIWAAQFVLPFERKTQEACTMDIVWQRQGSDVPIYTTYDASRSAHLLIASSSYRQIGAHTVPPYEPRASEIAPIPRRDENLDNEENGPQKPPPFSWTQTSDSVTIAFPVPSSTPTSNIKVAFSPRTLTVHVQGEKSMETFLPHYTMMELWDSISPSDSLWTLDREAEQSLGILTIHLDKAHEGTKWTHVFATSDVDVLETLDPSELCHIRESLEKYTSILKEGGDTRGLGLNTGSLAGGEMDEDIDEGVGRLAYLTWVRSDGSDAGWHEKQSGGPFTILSTPVPGYNGSDITLIIKNTIDGAVYSLKLPTLEDNSPTWTHMSTFSALAFVLASKRDTRFTHHISSTAVLAFENGVGNHGANMYLYHGHRPGEKWAKQSVLKVVTAGSLLGVGTVRNVKGEPILLALSERQFSLIHSVM
jgi:hypothetical protein